MPIASTGRSGRGRLGRTAVALAGLVVLAGCGSSSHTANGKPAATTVTTKPTTVAPTTTTGSTASEYQRLASAEQTFGAGTNQVEAALQALEGANDLTQAQLDQAVAPLATTLVETQKILAGPWPGRAGPDEKRLSADLTTLGQVAAAVTVGQAAAAGYAAVQAAYTKVQQADRVLRADLGLPAPTPAG
jgi:hypothetical protein